MISLTLTNAQSEKNLTDNFISEASDDISENNYRSCVQHVNEMGAKMLTAYKIQT
jgi:hypothetical protein